MQFTINETIEAPAAHVFAQLTDFDLHEAAARKRGAVVRRITSKAGPAAGMIWDIRFPLRGRERHIEMELTGFAPPERLEFTSLSPTMGGRCEFALEPVSARQTHLVMTMKLEPKTLSARLFVQSLKLARNRVMKRLRGRVAQYARTVERRFAGGV